MTIKCECPRCGSSYVMYSTRGYRCMACGCLFDEEEYTEKDWVDKNSDKYSDYDDYD